MTRAVVFVLALWTWRAAAEPTREYQLQSTDRLLSATSLGALRVGMQVRLSKRDRALKPAESGYSKTLAYGPGQRGVVVRFIRRRLSGYEFDMAIIRWEKQPWFEWDIPMNRMEQGKTYSGDDIDKMNRDNGPSVTLPSFELPAHPEMLAPVAAADVVAATKAADDARARQQALGPPRRTSCTAGTSSVPRQYIIFVRPGFDAQKVANDYAAKPGIVIRRVWAAMASFSAEAGSPAPFMADTRLSEVGDNCR